MASIKFDSLKNTQLNVEDYTYVDLFLDIEEKIIGSGINTTNRDIKVAFDLRAIHNSLKNLFNTAPGERFLLPNYGEDLRRFLFEPIDEIHAKALGSSIKDSIETWEPRIQVVNINVDAFIDTQEYEVTINVRIPGYNKQTFSIKGIFTKEGYLIRE